MKFVTAEEIYQQAGNRKGLPAWTYNSFELGVASFQNRLRELLPVVALEQVPEAGSLKALNARLLVQKNVAAVG
ncbi:MAG: hypothetical protein GY785_06015 [Gammaproteobacteria bacterium]|nr:hypothetical protein [Gammaproteobacteria bacterium]